MPMLALRTPVICEILTVEKARMVRSAPSLILTVVGCQWFACSFADATVECVSHRVLQFRLWICVFQAMSSLIT